MEHTNSLEAFGYMANVIALSGGIGEGATELDAFDAALCDAGVGNYNLVCVSSILPPKCQVVRLREVPPNKMPPVGALVP